MAVRNSLVAPVLGDQLISALPAAQEAAQSILGHRFARPELLAEALTHRSAALDHWAGKKVFSASNERLEFVGDRVLGLLMAGIADHLGFSNCLSVAPSESKAGVRKLATVLADAMEAVIGAVYLDAGLEVARGFVRRAWEPTMAAQVAPPKDAKTGLQEWAMHRALALPHYEVVSSEGPSHAPVFVISVTIAGQTATAQAGSKRQAEQAAAADLLGKLGS